MAVANVQLSADAKEDLAAFRRDKRALTRIRRALTNLEDEAPNLDIQTLTGRAPWKRLRAGDWRILFRPFTPAEIEHYGGGYLVARIVNRRDLERAIRTL
ncbi:MAG TPA: type II toxin-antitoxin system RelE/ParE family toxin [Actinomycetota bacterium]|nr:type II toxin-antitoxin system RelE/ParE family toxin [Actinomycetota bacterium]